MKRGQGGFAKPKEHDIRINFTRRENGPERLVAEAEILFDEPVLSGLKLVGFSLWKSPEGELYVTFPSRAFGTGSERRFLRLHPQRRE